MYSNLAEGLALGGEDEGNYSLFIQKELLKGRTFKNCTFNNDPLTTSNDFEIQYLEVIN